MTFEFVYCNIWYKYEDGKIIQQCSDGTYSNWDEPVCPVVIELQKQLTAIPEDVKPVVMQGLLHAYCHGIIDGKNKKIAEFKRVFKID
jgi:hypothetical protein